MNISRIYLLSVVVVLVVVACVALCAPLVNYLVGIDKQLMLALTFRHHTSLDMFWYHYSRLATWIPLVVVLLSTIWLKCPNDSRSKILLFVSMALLVLVLDQTSSGLIKPLVCRFRPSHDASISSSLQYVNGYRGGRFGFVSGHATNIVGIATWLCYMFRARMARLLFVFFAATLCYSRIYLSVHFPGDILCGSLLGFFLAYMGIKLLERFRLSFTTSYNPLPLLATYIATVVVLLVVNYIDMAG